MVEIQNSENVQKLCEKLGVELAQLNIINQSVLVHNIEECAKEGNPISFLIIEIEYDIYEVGSMYNYFLHIYTLDREGNARRYEIIIPEPSVFEETLGNDNFLGINFDNGPVSAKVIKELALKYVSENDIDILVTNIEE